METPKEIAGGFRARPHGAHKRSVGTVTVVGGSHGFPHAPVIAGLGARAAGAGLVRLVVPEESRFAAGSLLPEATVSDLGGEIPVSDVTVVGPGLGLGDEALALVRDLVRQHSGDPRHVNFIPGLFSWSNTILLGSLLKATPNGRRAGEPINHGANPNGGFRADGAVTAMCNSIAAVQPGYGNTAPVQLEVDPMIANDAEGIDKMCAMVRGIMNSGNTLLNINIIDAKRILEADKDPLKFPDLVVRVTGFTAFLAMLSPKFRKLVVDRVKSVKPVATLVERDLPIGLHKTENA